MAETSNIAKMAEILSKDLFSEFLWERVGPWNWNWPCENQEQHKGQTHPSDVVFYYDDPYRSARTYVQCDLKSYARGTIKAGNIKLAIESLSRSLSCAEVSLEWRKKYIHENVTPEICGLLFVYNHDGGYDKSFVDILKDVKNEALEIPKRSKVVVLGPMDIFWLNNVRYEIVQMRGKGELPARDNCHYFYPHLVQKKNIQTAKAATLEMLTSPWVILSHSNPSSKGSSNFVVFCRNQCGSVKEFLYLIDYLMHYQVLIGDNCIQVKCVNPDPNAPAYFGKAIDQYIDDCQGTSEIKKRLTSVTFNVISQVQASFSELEIGMSHA